MGFFRRKTLTPSQQEFLAARKRAIAKNIQQSKMAIAKNIQQRKAERLQKLRVRRIGEEGQLRLQQKGESEITKFKAAKRRIKAIKQAQFERSFAGKVATRAGKLSKAGLKAARQRSRSPIRRRIPVRRASRPSSVRFRKQVVRKRPRRRQRDIFDLGGGLSFN